MTYYRKTIPALTEDVIDSFVFDLTEYLNPLLPPEKHMGNFFDTDDKYEPIRQFCLDWFDKYYTGERNYN